VAKILLVVLGLLAAWWILRSYRRRVDRRGAPPPVADGEKMVQCAQCGVHLPRSESLMVEGRAFCSADHQQRHEAGRDAG
jgi:uncharacterized protein